VSSGWSLAIDEGGSMDITHRRMNRVDVLALSGRMMPPEAAQLKEQFDHLFAENRFRIVLDLAQLEYISSGGLRVLIEARKRAQDARLGGSERGDIRIVHLPQRIKEVFDLTGFTAYFQYFDDLADAVGSY
jgi:anti-sigma B factor antagonist